MKVKIRFWVRSVFTLGLPIPTPHEMETELACRPMKGDHITFGPNDPNVPREIQARWPNSAVVCKVFDITHMPTHGHFPHDPTMEIRVVV